MSEEMQSEVMSEDLAPEEIATTDQSRDLEAELAAAVQKAEENWDRLVRLQAEMDNLRRRTEKDLQNAHKFALEKFARELLQVVDSLELGIQAATGDFADIDRLREGGELTLKQMHAVLEKFGVEAVNPVGQKFNPDQHQAMAMEPSAEVEAGNVLRVFQKGYLLNERLLRPALVVISEAAKDVAARIDEQA